MIEVKNVSKIYGNSKAVDNLSFTVPKGQILGFLGPNGAGKTTTMRIITGFMAPSMGTVTVDSYDVVEKSMEVRKKIGYLPETPPLYTEMTVKSYLDFVARLKGVKSKAHRKKRLDYVAEACWIGDVMNKTCSKLSKGYRQRVGLAQALIHEPDVIILDEPTIGLDPKQIQETRNLITGLKGNHTVILSTHILPEVQMTCERVVIIANGQIIADDTPDGLIARQSGGRRVTLTVRGEPRDSVESHLSSIEGVTRVQLQDQDKDNINTFIVDSNQAGIQEVLAREIVNKDWGLLALNAIGNSLEDTFIDLITKEGEN